LTRKQNQNQSLTQYLIPASEQSNSSFYDEYRFLTNWDYAEHNGWTLPATGEPHDWCGIWNTIGCVDHEKHMSLGFGDVSFVKHYQRSCFRAVCKICYEKWIGRQADRSKKRVEKYAKISNRTPIHVILSISQQDYGLPFPEMKKKARRILQEIGIIGCGLIFHPFRFHKKSRRWYYSPHFHIVGFGRIGNIAKVYYRYYWLIKYAGTRKSVFHTFYYLLSHSGVNKKFHSISWLGVLSYSKLEVKEEPKISRCPLCEGEFVEIYYDGFDPPIPPDKFFEGVLDSDGWYQVNTMPEQEINDSYEYAPTRELDYLLRGMATAV